MATKQELNFQSVTDISCISVRKTHLPPALCGPKIPVGVGHASGQIGHAKICNFVATLLEHKRLRKFVSTPGASGRSYRVRPNGPEKYTKDTTDVQTLM
ncbi:hypothetical protein GQ55_2G058800 [Panicum hallii var. hallii]|uniref:Uncharacterized protein n=1 Tax=Panicum hallii var. hallii TaxID=1504633 RepID=A0A2T7ELV8_9POAL|nr:hypothetical protein GQ55_2G058800 [Panicum hallii var. hallii]